MKKILVMVAVAMMTAMNASAQNGYDETKHEVAITYGVGSNSDIIDAFENIGGGLVGAKFENEKYFGALSAEYFYHLENWLPSSPTVNVSRMSISLATRTARARIPM